MTLTERVLCGVSKSTRQECLLLLSMPKSSLRESGWLLPRCPCAPPLRLIVQIPLGESDALTRHTNICQFVEILCASHFKRCLSSRIHHTLAQIPNHISNVISLRWELPHILR